MTRRERLERKAERRREWAQKAEARSNQAYQTARRIGDMIPMGQPILVGHHSEGRHRRDLDRIDSNMRKSIENSDLSKHHESCADGIENALDRSIFSDDSNAVEALEARIAEREAEREKMKLVNKLYRKADIAGLQAIGIDYEALKKRLAEAGSYWGSAPHLPYELSNLGGRITADRKRLEYIKRNHETRAKAEAAPGGVTITEHSGGYCCVTFAEKPERAILDLLRTGGYRWSAPSWYGYKDKLPEEVRAMTFSLIACQKCGIETVDVRKREDGQQLCDLCATEPEPIVIKGAPGGPEGKWEEVQAVQDKPFIYIQYNGSRWLGDEEDNVESLANMLRNYTLSPLFAPQYSENPCHGIEDPDRRGHYIDGPRMYRVDGVYRFSGNFYEYSHAFGIDTNHRPTIELLTGLIDANVKTAEYQTAIAELAKAEEDRRQREIEAAEKRKQQRIAEAKAVLASE